MTLTSTVNRCIALLCAFCVHGALPAHAQRPSGYTRAPTEVLPDSLNESLVGGRFRISIMRVSATADERKLIEHAESLVPPREAIERAAGAVTGGGHVAALAQAAQAPGARWWWRDWDGVLLPYALTGAAVTHYMGRIRSLSAQPNPFAEHNPGVEHSASVEYTARVVRPVGQSSNIEVRLDVKFRFYCGPRCAISFTHARTVEFDKHGAVVQIIGDRPPGYVVS